MHGEVTITFDEALAAVTTNANVLENALKAKGLDRETLMTFARLRATEQYLKAVKADKPRYQLLKLPQKVQVNI